MAPASTATPPPNFPPSVTYLSHPAPSRLLPRSLQLAYCTPSPASSLPNPPPRVQIRTISDPAHPAHGQSGLFNASGKKLERGTWIRDYVGLVHLEKEADPTSDYDLCLERVPASEGAEAEVVGIDATKTGNEARFVNDYRGIRGFQRPNAVFELRTWDLPGGKGRGVRMAVWAGPHGVEKGSEICVSYGRGFWDQRRKEAEVHEG
ncbi:SPOSA6832_04780 [Sporobolomyces salmonicolor]|uniref:SPOSA6832_04780-mRNA-1:cds n=1 Tax=Sporidiobolus salmonicolor TaxID=5005 RepID=A0A0D6ESG6_SPOSA|nr:SPOSA6832_04780 [Sporobolomyces salmonicolor]